MWYKLCQNSLSFCICLFIYLHFPCLLRSQTWFSCCWILILLLYQNERWLPKYEHTVIYAYSLAILNKIQQFFIYDELRPFGFTLFEHEPRKKQRAKQNRNWMIDRRFYSKYVPTVTFYHRFLILSSTFQIYISDMIHTEQIQYRLYSTC